MPHTIAIISQIEAERSPESDASLAAAVSTTVPDRTISKLGWHFWFVVVDLLSGLCLGGVASGQTCPGGQCPINPDLRQVPPVPAVEQTPTADYQRAIVRVGREDLSQPGASYSG